MLLILRRLFGSRIFVWITLLLLLATISSGQTAAQRPYVVLVSLDGFRYDYTDRYDAKNLKAFRTIGAAAIMIPSFPSLTFPNHLSIVTGLYPEHHGIVANDFYDPEQDAEYRSSRNAAEGVWYGGTPLWVLAEKQGVHAASYFWPGTEAEIQGIRPLLFSHFDEKIPDEERIQTVLGWLKRPESVRPHFVTLYFGEADHAGHTFGPESEETRSAVKNLDERVGELWEGLQKLALPINLIVVSDHGMLDVDQGRVDLWKFVDPHRIRIEGGGAIALLYAQDKDAAEQAYQDLHGKSPHFEVYRREETPPHWHYRGNRRIGDLVVVARDRSSLRIRDSESSPAMGGHGYDPSQMKTMRAIFFAAGPNIRPGSRVAPFENVNLYPLIARILGLTPPAKLDGSGKALDQIYRK